MKDFTFCILTYNHEKYILDTLESIKYQITEYPKGIENYLVIGDDCSNDKTVDIINFWLKKNKNYFKKICFFTNEKNIGACKTLNILFENIVTENFKIIEGDDLFSSIDIIKLFEKHDDSNIVSCCSLQFENYIIKTHKNIYISTMSKKLLNKKIIKLLSTISVPFNGTAMWFKKSLITQQLKERLNNFFVIGDRNIWLSLFHDNPLNKINYSFECRPIILYRINDTSITSSTSPNKKKYFIDYENYIKSLETYKLSMTEKLLYKSFILSKKRGKPYLNILAYINKFLNNYSNIFTRKDINILLESIQKEQNYLIDIRNRSLHVLEGFYNEEN